jgi:uncharacterized membrane protein SpoIIM required for sporulation
VIIDLPRFIEAEQPYWTELERILRHFDNDPGYSPGLEELKRFHYLYERTSAALARVQTFAAEPELIGYLQSLVARAYGEIHESRERPRRASPGRWLFRTFPQTFRRHWRAFALSLAVTLAGSMFGGFAVLLDPEAKPIIMPFPHLLVAPEERVAQEEAVRVDQLKGEKATFSTHLMTHNTKVSLLTLALGMTWGIGTVLMLFYNGIVIGAVVLDFVAAGQTTFLAGWLLPHGSVEIPAILIAGQAGFVLAGALIGWGTRLPLALRLRQIGPDLVTLIGGVALLLIWAGIVEAFLSQYHEPIIPYSLKIGFGALQLFLLTLFLARSGAEQEIGSPER